MTGDVGILNVGAGDTKLSFDPSNPAERIRAARIVKDMIRRGYALLVQTKTESGHDIYRRATDFDESTCEYIIADFDPVIAQQEDAKEGDHEPTPASNAAEVGAAGTETRDEDKAPPRGRGHKRRIPAATTRGVAVARSAGG